MQRTRSSGSSGYTGWTAMTTKISRIRKVYGYGAYELQTGLTQNGYQNGLIDDVSSITDVLGARDCFNPCTHTQHSNYEGLSSPKALDRTAEAIAAIAPLAKEATTGWFGCCVELIGGVRKVSPKIFFNNNWPSYSLPTPAWTDMVQEVGEGLAGDMGSKSLILSSLVELGKTLSMLRNPMGLIKLITKTKSWRTLSLADGLKRVSSQWLEYRYGWRPLFSDIEAILSAADKVNDHMQYLQNSVGRLVPVRARRSYSTNVTITTPNQLLFPTYSSCGAKLVGINAVATRDAAFGVNILRGESFRLASRASYLKQHLGVDRLLETGWDLIPFSFVIDWFVDIQSLLAKGPISWWRYDLRKMGYSVKDTLTVTAEWQTAIGSYPPYFPFKMESGATQEVKGLIAYTRVPGFPSGTSSTGLFGNLQLVNLADGAALIAQRLL